MYPTEETIQQMVDEEIKKVNADIEARRTPSAEEQLRQQLDAAKFRELMVDEALLHNVRPPAVKYVVREAEQKVDPVAHDRRPPAEDASAERVAFSAAARASFSLSLIE